MRGEFIGVWSDTWREIWLPLIDHEDVPEDLFCELYRELAAALRDPIGDEAIALAVNDAILLPEAFERALALAGIEVELLRVKEVFNASGATELADNLGRRAAAETALAALIGDPGRSGDLFSRALLEIAGDPQKRGEAKERALDGIVNDTVRSREAFEGVRESDLAGERALVTFLEAVHPTLEDLCGDKLSNRYFNLLAEFIEKFSLRYDLRRPCTLCPTLPGMFASLVRDLHAITSQDAHLDALMKDFESAVRDLRSDCSDGHIKTCIQKQVNLLEAIGRTCPGVTQTELGGICNQLGRWPHNAIRSSLKNLYGFTSDYPGIRHGGTPANALRLIEMRDMIAMCILLTGFTPYLTDSLDADAVYRGL